MNATTKYITNNTRKVDRIEVHSEVSQTWSVDGGKLCLSFRAEGVGPTEWVEIDMEVLEADRLANSLLTVSLRIRESIAWHQRRADLLDKKTKGTELLSCQHCYCI